MIHKLAFSHINLPRILASHTCTSTIAHNTVALELTHPRNTIPDLPPDPFPELLTSNAAPDPGQLQVIQETIASTSALSLSITARIRLLEAEICQLQSRNEEFQRSVDAHRAITSPLRYTPDDVLLEIITAVMDMTPSSQIYTQLWAIGGACRRWRNLTMSSPLLWRSVYVQNFAPRRIDLRLQRSAEIPLLLDFHSLRGTPEEADYTMSQRAVDGLLEHSARWRRVALPQSSAHLAQILLSPDTRTFPLLESTSMDIQPGLDYERFFRRLSALTALRLNLISPDCRLPEAVPWSQLSRLVLSNHLTAQDLAHAVPLLPPNAVVSFIDLESLTGVLDVAPLPGKMRSLTFAGCRNHFMRFALPLLLSPSLRKLELRATDPRRPTPLEHTPRHLTSSRCALTHLALDLLSDEPSLLELLSSPACQSLEHLECAAVRAPNEGLLRHLERQTALLPSLRTLTVTENLLHGFFAVDRLLAIFAHRPDLRTLVLLQGAAKPTVEAQRWGKQVLEKLLEANPGLEVVFRPAAADGPGRKYAWDVCRGEKI